MPTSDTKRAYSCATDSPLGAPPGNDPYKTVRAKNWAQEDGGDVAAKASPYETKQMGNAAMNINTEEPKPAQGV